VGTGPVWSGTQPVKIQNLYLNSKNEKFPKKFLKILQGAMNLIVSIFSKIRSFSIVCGDLKLNQKRKKMGWPIKAHRSNRPVNRSVNR
jgi:hypothetical protein